MSSHFSFSYGQWGSQGKNTEVVCHSLLQWTTFCQTSPLWPVGLGWPHMAWLSFIELDKAVSVWSDSLVFCDYSFSLSAFWCLLSTPTVLLGFLLPWTWSISLPHVGYLFIALLQQSTATAPYLGQGVSPHNHPSWPWTWSNSSSCTNFSIFFLWFLLNQVYKILFNLITFNVACNPKVNILLVISDNILKTNIHLYYLSYYQFFGAHLLKVIKRKFQRLVINIDSYLWNVCLFKIYDCFTKYFL